MGRRRSADASGNPIDASGNPTSGLLDSAKRPDWSFASSRTDSRFR
ncbi:MAG: hypothetical protein ACR2GR_01435 [Rhodothermales bacterium]